MAAPKENAPIQKLRENYRDTSRWRVRIAAILCLILIFALLQGNLRYCLCCLLNNHQSRPFDWQEIKPTPYLAYTPCFGEYECARLEVPIDWNAKTSGAKAAIAIIRLPAQVPVTDPRYGGPILINPGGPGVSGVNEVLARGKSFQAIADLRAGENQSPKSPGPKLDGSLKYFDLIGFDPRGVNNSTPHLQCFADSIARQIWDAQASAEGIFGSSNQTFNLMWARAKALGKACSDNGTGIAQFMNTPVVVADMVAIIERHGEWREREAKQLLAEGLITEQRQTVLERNRWKRGQEPLQYWGFSYGTILGQTFATLEPSRISRVVLDGIVDIEDYYQCNWKKNLQLTDQIVDRFCKYCHQAGPLQCAFYSGSAPHIKKRLEDLLVVMKDEPVFTGASETHGPEIFTYSDIMLEIRESLYEPVDRFPRIAILLAALENPLSSSSGEIFAGYKSRADYRKSRQSTGDGELATTGILCSDAPDLTSTTKSSLLSYAKSLSTQSKYIGASWVSHRLTCSGWVTRPKLEFDHKTAGGKTKHPMLFIGNTLDPVTPIANAHKMAAMWDGSVVAEMRGEGHCTYAAKSVCMNTVIGRYFQTGEMPEFGKVCMVDKKPFGLL